MTNQFGAQADHASPSSTPNSGGSEANYAAQAFAIREVLVNRGPVSDETLDKTIHEFTDVLTAANGARVVARCWADPAFRERFLHDATSASLEVGISGPEGKRVRAVENTPSVHNVIVCTQCSCTAWPLIGLPPDWYKSAPYRSRVVREARNVLSEMGLALPPETEIRVWDTTGDTRYVVLPQRPPNTETWTEDQLRSIVTRESLIGVAIPALRY